jgi:hypothetical protein
MAKYDPLKVELRTNQGGSWTASFSEIESTLAASLPRSAYDHREWWANDRTHPQAQAWMLAGWRVESCNLTSKRVIFRKK